MFAVKLITFSGWKLKNNRKNWKFFESCKSPRNLEICLVSRKTLKMQEIAHYTYDYITSMYFLLYFEVNEVWEYAVIAFKVHMQLYIKGESKKNVSFKK